MSKKWNDGCDHKSTDYVGTFTYYESPTKDLSYDIYVYDDTLGQEICARYGNEDPDYLSIGDLSMLMRGYDRLPIYRAIHNFLMEKGEIVFKKKPLPIDKYVEEKGEVCPMCGTSWLKGDFVEVNEGKATQIVKCLEVDCKATWTDTYNLTGYKNLEV